MVRLSMILALAVLSFEIALPCKVPAAASAGSPAAATTPRPLTAARVRQFLAGRTRREVVIAHAGGESSASETAKRMASIFAAQTAAANTAEQAYSASAPAAATVSHCLPAITAVDGSPPSSITLTASTPGNTVFITGCGFGTGVVRGGVYMMGPNGFKSYLIPTKWSDRGVVATVDPTITGAADASHTITLVVNGLQATGLSFYAARQHYLLPSIPRAAVNISTTSPSAAPVMTCYITCIAVGDLSYIGDQYGTNWPYDDATVLEMPISAQMERYGNSYFVVSGPDIYDFSHLSPGFAVDSASASFWMLLQSNCDALMDGYPGYKLSSQGLATTENFDFKENKFIVTTNVWNCFNVAYDPEYDANVSWSNYDVNVIVDGPRGLQNPQFWPTTGWRL